MTEVLVVRLERLNLSTSHHFFLFFPSISLFVVLLFLFFVSFKYLFFLLLRFAFSCKLVFSPDLIVFSLIVECLMCYIVFLSFRLLLCLPKHFVNSVSKNAV